MKLRQWVEVTKGIMGSMKNKQIKRKNSLDNVMTLLWSERETENRHKEKQQIDTKRNRQLQKK